MTDPVSTLEEHETALASSRRHMMACCFVVAALTVTGTAVLLLGVILGGDMDSTAARAAKWVVVALFSANIVAATAGVICARSVRKHDRLADEAWTALNRGSEHPSDDHYFATM